MYFGDELRLVRFFSLSNNWCFASVITCLWTMNLHVFAEFLGPVWTFYSFLTIRAVFRTERLDAIFSLSLVSLIVLFVGRRMINMFSAFFVKKGFCIPISWFKVWCLGNNLCEKYAFTFIQHSRSTFWLISTEAYNPEACKFRLFV